MPKECKILDSHLCIPGSVGILSAELTALFADCPPVIFNQWWFLPNWKNTLYQGGCKSYGIPSRNLISTETWAKSTSCKFIIYNSADILPSAQYSSEQMYAYRLWLNSIVCMTHNLYSLSREVSCDSIWYSRNWSDWAIEDSRRCKLDLHERTCIRAVIIDRQVDLSSIYGNRLDVDMIHWLLTWLHA